MIQDIVITTKTSILHCKNGVNDSTTYTAQKSGENPNEEFTVVFQPIATIVNSLLAVSDVRRHSTTYFYNDFGQWYSTNGIAAGSVMNLSYDYDGAGNVKRVNGLPRPPLVPGTTDYTHTANRLVSSSGVSTKNYSYDNVGNITSDGVRTFEYDQSNRLVQVTESGVVQAEYAYDAFNRRVKKIVDGETVYYHYDANGLLICETDASGKTIRDHVYLNGEPVAMKTAGNWYWFICDHLGTPQTLIDNSGNVVWEAAYLPFGKARIITAGAENSLRFPGQYFDKETGLHYNWNRYYGPELGRYITADPIGLDGGSNLYAYAENAPVNWIDPNGLSALKIISLCAKGYKVIKTVGWKEAVKAVRKGENVLSGSHAEAKRLARAASSKKKPIRDTAHNPEEGQMPHYHPNPRNGSHVFYQIAAGVTASHYLQCDDPEKLCTEAVLGQVIDLFNPLSLGQDAIDIMDSF